MEKHAKKIVLAILSFILAITKTVLIVPPGICRYSPSCTEFAKEAIQTMPAHRAMVVIFMRLLRCNPFAKGGFDPVKNEKGKVCP